MLDYRHLKLLPLLQSSLQGRNNNPFLDNSFFAPTINKLMNIENP